MFVDVHTTGLELRHIENVAKHFVEPNAGAMNVMAVFEIFLRAERAEGLLLHQFRKADDMVQRRAQFVIHIGEKLRFCAVSGFGGGLLHMIFFGEYRELLLLYLERLSRFRQIGDRRHQSALRIGQLFFIVLELRNVGADGYVTAVLRAPFIDLQPAAVGEARFVSAGAGGSRLRRARFPPEPTAPSHGP